MHEEESILLQEITRRYNVAVRNGKVLDADSFDWVDLKLSVLKDPTVFPLQEFSKYTGDLAKWRDGHHKSRKQVAENLKDKWRDAFTRARECTSEAEYIHELIVDTFVREYEYLARDGGERDGAVVGVPLKCIILLGHFARSCTTAGEHTLLVENGFFEGADARMRSMYEHLIFAVVIANSPCEIAERYQDSAAIEWLREERVKRQLVAEKELDAEALASTEEFDQIAEYEAQAIARWGKEIKKPYGWARPALHNVLRTASETVQFVHLERVAGASHLRPDYLAMNHQVHAGALGIIRHTFTQESLVPTGPCFGHPMESRVPYLMTFAMKILAYTAYIAADYVSFEAKDFDQMLKVGQLVNRAESIGDLFAS